jgi:uncharacterized RDD family membrane protein YckC
MFCPNCGAEAADADRFCRSCGRELHQTTTGDAFPSPQPAIGRPAEGWAGHLAGQPSPRADASAGSELDGVPAVAHIGRRTGAFAIDSGMLLVSAFAFLVLVIMVHDATADVAFGDLSETGQDGVAYPGLGIWSVLYAIGTWVLNATGGSIGKRIVRLRVVRSDLQTPGWRIGLVRTIAAWLSWPILGLGFLWAIWTTGGRRGMTSWRPPTSSARAPCRVPHRQRGWRGRRSTPVRRTLPPRRSLGRSPLR